MNLDLFVPSDFLTRSRPRGVRPEIAAAVPGSNIYPGPSQWGEIPLPNMSAATVMGLPAASRARYLISNAVAQMTPLQLWTPDGYIDPNPPTILTRPNSVYGTFDFIQMMIDMAVTHGNFCALQADFDSDGYPQQLTPLPHGFWLAYYDDDGYLTYSINGMEYSRDEVFHIRANASPIQPMGVGVVTQFRRSLGQALDQQNFVADTYRSGSIPAGTIEMLDQAELDPLQAAIVTNQWLTNHAGGRAPAVIPNNMKFSPLSWSPEDMQFLQSREFTVSEIAFMFNMDPTDLGAALAGASNTYANIEQHEQSRTINTYGSWMRRVEEEFSDLVPGRGQAKMVPANLMRTDTKTVAEVQQLEIGNEVLTVDEARKIVGKRPVPKPVVETPCPTCGLPQSESAMPGHLADHATAGETPATFGKGAPPAPGAPNANVEVLAGAKAEPDPDDPNISQTPIKVKV